MLLYVYSAARLNGPRINSHFSNLPNKQLPQIFQDKWPAKMVSV